MGDIVMDKLPKTSFTDQRIDGSGGDIASPGVLISIDWALLFARYQGRTDRLASLLGSVESACHESAEALRLALAAKDFSRMATNAHALVGVLNIVEARTAAELARQTEVAARGLDIDAAELATCLVQVLKVLCRDLADGCLTAHNRVSGILATTFADEEASRCEQKAFEGQSSTVVLVVDDQAIIREMLRDLLTDVGLLVDLASDGRTAIEMVAQHEYGVVLMDVHMPIMDGIEATRRIRAAGGTRVPILAMTADLQLSDRLRCLSVGMDDFVGKPFDGDDLLARVVRWLPKLEPKRA